MIKRRGNTALTHYPGYCIHLCSLILFLPLVLASCGFPGIVTTAGQLPVVKSTPQAQPLPPVRFPQDEAAHRDLNEWWYYTGRMNAVTPDGKTHHYGFELVFFQALRSDLPPFYAAHFAISDVTRGEFHFDQRHLIEPDALIPNGTSTSGIRVSIGDWSIRGVNGLDHLEAAMTNYTLHVDLLGLKPATLHNGNGLITYGLGGFSYYYSRTRMELSGTLIDHHQPLQVNGVVWMDHQWGNFLALGGGGWDWFSIQLNNDTAPSHAANNTACLADAQAACKETEMMLYLIRDATGKTISTYVEDIGSHEDFHLLPPGALRVDVLDHWKSPVTGANYPSGWQLKVNDPQLQVSLTLMPELKDQELVVYQSTGNSYWEGAVSISGQVVQGEGYVELTGYSRG